MIRAIVVTPTGPLLKPAPGSGVTATVTRSAERCLIPIDQIARVDEISNDESGTRALIWMKSGGPTAVRVSETIDVIRDAMNGRTPA